MNWKRKKRQNQMKWNGDSERDLTQHRTSANSIFNKCIGLGIFPDYHLKRAMITPIQKAGNELEMENWRSISVLSSISKCFQKIIKNKLSNFIKKCNIISTQQFGFMEGKSTEDNKQNTRPRKPFHLHFCRSSESVWHCRPLTTSPNSR